MADEKNSVNENPTTTSAPVAQKVEKVDAVVDQITAAATEKKAVAKKVVKKATKKAAKKVTKKVAKKTSDDKPATKKASKKVAKKTAKKVAKKVTKKVTKKAASVKKAATKKQTAAKKVIKAEAMNVESRIEQLQSIFKENLEGLNETGDKAEALAKNIWLAGLGAYSRAYEEMLDRYDDVQDRVDEINEEGQKVFGDLVKRGQDIQSDIEGQVSKSRETLEERVEEIRSRFGGGLSSFVDIPERLREAAEKVEEIGKKLRGKK